MNKTKTCDACKTETDQWEPRSVGGINLVICQDAAACRQRAEKKGIWKS